MPEERPQRDSKVALTQTDLIINQVVDLIRDTHLPVLIGKVKKEFLEELHQLRVELQSFKEETRSQFKKHEKSINEMLYMTPATPTKNKDTSGGLAELEKFYFLLEAKVANI